MNTVIIRDAKQEDIKRILEIYAHYVKNTAITFEYNVPDLQEFQNRVYSIMEHYPYLVAEVNGVVHGYVYARAFIERAAYEWSCETTIYLDCVVQKNGLGRKLYEALEECLRGMGILNMYACIACPEIADEYLNYNSVEFHTHLRFHKVGEFHKCGYKFGRWYNMVWMEKVIGEHKKKQTPVKFVQNTMVYAENTEV